jgi:very-short-patch-repair endonuclease
MGRNEGSEHLEFINAFKAKKARALIEKQSAKKKWRKDNPEQYQKLLNERATKRIKKAAKKQKALQGIKPAYTQHFVNTHCNFRSFGYLENFETSPKEKAIEVILTKIGVRFYREVSFDGRKRFDFYLFDYDVVIEYDGRQHFESAKEVKNDQHKNKILQKNGIKYFRYNFSHRNLSQSIKTDLGAFLGR